MNGNRKFPYNDGKKHQSFLSGYTGYLQDVCLTRPFLLMKGICFISGINGRMWIISGIPDEIPVKD